MNTKKRKVVIIIQARMGATRLPGKVMKKVMGKPLLHYLLERVKRVGNADEILVATTNKHEDDAIEALCKEIGVPVLRGDEKDVLDRYVQAATHCHADVVVRITGDCPLIDPGIVEMVIHAFLENDYDYVGNTLKLTYPRGMDTEVFSMEALQRAAQEAKDPSEREHVTLHLYSNPDSYRLLNVPYDKDMSTYRLTVDTEEDFRLITEIFERLYPRNPHFSLEEVLNLLEDHPELAEINAHVVQKPIK